MHSNRNIDPELEKLRNEVDGPPNLDTLALNIQRSSCKIHASYLFENIGKATLQRLCLLLSSTATGKLYNGWQEFAAHLGLTIEQIRCIDYDFKGLQDPTYYVLLAYVQHDEATLDKLLSVLQKMHRMDIINELKDHFIELIYAILRNVPNDVEAPTILKSNYAPRAPLVLSPVKIVESSIKGGSGSLEYLSVENSNKKKRPYACKVLLTFADDSLATMQYITKVFRSWQPRIGVVILQEQQNHVYSKAEEFIDDCFKQVDYIIPILTREYIERISHHDNITADVQNRLDAKYIKYIYSLLRYEYMKNQCCNNRVRCIVPDEEIYTVIEENLHPTLQVWFKSSDISTFINNILLSKFLK
ncbi:hypothetical protein KM043_006708 [Ampulex compressa]|nr:hypothetical protein KM043_006708 [Ampulex compressa]